MISVAISRPLNKDTAQTYREQLLPLVLDCIQHASETENGYLFELGRNDEVIHWASQFLEVERVVNPFLRGLLIIESNNGPVKLELEGPSGTKEFLHEEFRLGMRK